MKKNVKSIMVYLGGAITAFTFLIITGLGSGSDNTAYVDNDELFKSFKLTKELKADYETIRQKREFILDSMKTELIAMQVALSKDNGGHSEIYARRAELYRIKAEEFRRGNLELDERLTEQVVTQINQYVMDYGTKTGYDYIFGANGNGNLMYADEARNITEEVIQFANAAYDNEQK